MAPLTNDERIRYNVLLAEPNLDSGQLEELEYLHGKNCLSEPGNTMDAESEIVEKDEHNEDDCSKEQDLWFMKNQAV